MAEKCEAHEWQVICQLTPVSKRRPPRHFYATCQDTGAKEPPPEVIEHNRVYHLDGICECGCDGLRYRYHGLGHAATNPHAETASVEPLDPRDEKWLAEAQKRKEEGRV